MTFEREIDAAQLGKALDNIQDCVRRGLIDPEMGTIPKQAQLLTELCINLTPPRNAAQGRRRIAADVAMLFNPLQPDAIRDDGLRALARKGTRDDWNRMAEKAKNGKFAGKRAVEPSLLLHDPHKINLMRGWRGGGVSRLPRWVTIWKDRGALRSVIKSVQSRVGWARAGWLRAYRALGGNRVAEWYAKHGSVRGIFVDGLANENPYVVVGNDTPWGRGGEANRIVGNAIQTRIRAMERYATAMARLASQNVLTPWQQKRAQIAAQFFNNS